MGLDLVQFVGDELRLVGGDYGQITLEGITEEARRACDALVAATRRGTGVVVVNGLIAQYDNTPDLFEDRHAGREGTSEWGVGPEPVDRSPSEEGTAARYAGVRGPQGAT